MYSAVGRATKGSAAKGKQLPKLQIYLEKGILPL
jgi:hypothetical protein